MYYLRARYYNPTIGRFTQEDIYRGDGLNLYAYVKNNPVMWVDPSGYQKHSNTKNMSSFGEMSTDDATRYDEFWRSNGIGSENTWADFKKYNPDSTIDDYFDLVNGQSPWPKGYVPENSVLKSGDKFEMAMNTGQPYTLPGGFGTTNTISDVDFVRNDLAVKVDWKDDPSKVVTYQVKDGIELPVLSGDVGPQIDLVSNQYLPGGATQIQMLTPSGTDRMDFIEIIDVRNIQ